MGEAYFNRGDCGGAVTELSASEQQSAVLSRPEFVANIKKWYQACSAKGVLLPAEYNPLNATTLKTYTDATGLAKKLLDVREQNKDVWRSEFDEQLRKADAELKTAQTKLTNGQRTRLGSDFKDSSAASDRAVAILRPMEATLNTAIETVSSVAKLVKEVEQAIEGAVTTDATIESVKSSLTDAMQASRKSGREQLAQAKERLATGQKTQNLAVVNEGLRYAQGASTILNQLLDQAKTAARELVKQQLGNAVAAADEAFSRVSAAMSALDRRAAQRPDVMQDKMKSDRDAIEKNVEGLRRRFERARKAEDLRSLAETTKLTVDANVALDDLIKSFGPLTLRDRGVDAALEEGARLFMSGEYEKALAALDAVVGRSDVPLQQQVRVFRAASLYALFVRTGEADQQLRGRVLDEISQTKQLNSMYQPDPNVFSPRFLRVYQSGSLPSPSQPAAGAAAQQ
jgi:hypothetical protein